MKRTKTKLELRTVTVKTLTTSSLTRVQGGNNPTDSCVETESCGYTKVYTYACGDAG